jgi:L-erythrulose 1-phosphate isomerase
MTSKKFLLGTNWKMNKNMAEASDYACRLAALLGHLPGQEKIQIFIIPPYTSIETVKRLSQGRFWVGAQNVHWEEWGAYTGEISAPMLRDLSIDLVELGHAERRRHFFETDEIINKKLHRVVQYGFHPLLCVGERSEEKFYGVQRETVGRQLRIALNGILPAQTSGLIVAYEPVWAIGEGGTAADAPYLEMMLVHIREVLTDVLGAESARDVRVIYGGTINQSNASEILNGSSAEGLFVGRAAWDIEGLTKLIDMCIEIAERRSGVEGSPV